MSDIQYGKIIVETSYQAGLPISERKGREESIMTSRDTLVSDLLETVGVLTRNETGKLDIHLEVNKKGEIRLVRKWSI